MVTADEYMRHLSDMRHGDFIEGRVYAGERDTTALIALAVIVAVIAILAVRR